MKKQLRKTLKKMSFEWKALNQIDVLELKSNLIKNLNNQNTPKKLKYAILKDQHYFNYF